MGAHSTRAHRRRRQRLRSGASPRVAPPFATTKTSETSAHQVIAMKSLFACIAVAALGSACSKKVDNGPPPTLTMTVTPTTITQNGKFHVKMAVANFTIKDIGAAAQKAIELGQAPNDPTVGHWHLYIDSTDADPIEEDGTALEKDEVRPCKIDTDI